MAMIEHPLRRTIVGEMHLRRWPALTAPCTIVQWVRLLAPAERDAELAALQAGSRDARPASDSPRHAEGVFAPGIGFAWERHSEASSFAVFAADGSEVDLARAIAWGESLPGATIRATRIRVERDEGNAERRVTEAGFDRAELVSGRITGGLRIWSDFRLQPDGYGRLVVAAAQAEPHDLSRQLKRLQELGNYRNLALLGLPEARSAWARLDRVEAQLRTLGEHVPDPGLTDDALLGELSALSLEMVAISTATNFRMSATAAYARLVEERLAELRAEAIPGFQSLEEFTQRRFLPAARTCAALSERERRLSERAGQLSSLLRTRIETRIENQNAQQIASMERSAAMQLRLQELVEGLSVVALSYYAVGLAGYVLKGAESRWPRFEAPQALAVLVPVAVAGVWLLVHRLKRRLLKAHH